MTTLFGSIAVAVSALIGAYLILVLSPVFDGAPKEVGLLFATATLSIVVAFATLVANLVVGDSVTHWFKRHLVQCAILYLVCLIGFLAILGYVPGYLFLWGVGAMMGIMGNILGQGLHGVWTEARSNKADARQFVGPQTGDDSGDEGP